MSFTHAERETIAWPTHPFFVNFRFMYDNAQKEAVRMAMMSAGFLASASESMLCLEPHARIGGLDTASNNGLAIRVVSSRLNRGRTCQ